MVSRVQPSFLPHPHALCPLPQEVWEVTVLLHSLWPTGGTVPLRGADMTSPPLGFASHPLGCAAWNPSTLRPRLAHPCQEAQRFQLRIGPESLDHCSHPSSASCCVLQTLERSPILRGKVGVRLGHL